MCVCQARNDILVNVTIVWVLLQDSLQGDLDLEYQSRLLASFAQAGGRQGPFGGEDAESASIHGPSTSKGQPPPVLPRVFPSLDLDREGTDLEGKKKKKLQ